MIFGDVNKFAIFIKDINKPLTPVLVYINSIPIGTDTSSTFLSSFIHSAKFFSKAKALPDFMKNLPDNQKFNVAFGLEILNLNEEEIYIANQYVNSSWEETFDDFLIMKYRCDNKIVFLWKLEESENYQLHFSYPNIIELGKLYKHSIPIVEIEKVVTQMVQKIRELNLD